MEGSPSLMKELGTAGENLGVVWEEPGPRPLTTPCVLYTERVMHNSGRAARPYKANGGRIAAREAAVAGLFNSSGASAQSYGGRHVCPAEPPSRRPEPREAFPRREHVQMFRRNHRSVEGTRTHMEGLMTRYTAGARTKIRARHG